MQNAFAKRVSICLAYAKISIYTEYNCIFCNDYRKGLQLKYTARKSKIPPNPFRRGCGRGITNPYQCHQQQLRSRGQSIKTVEQVWAQSLEMRETEKLVTGILEQIVSDAVDIAQLRTVPVALPTEPANVFEQMDMPVRDWCMKPIHQAVEAQIHNRPVTLDI